MLAMLAHIFITFITWTCPNPISPKCNYHYISMCSLILLLNVLSLVLQFPKVLTMQTVDLPEDLKG